MFRGLRTRWPSSKKSNRRRSATCQRPVVSLYRRLRIEPLEDRRLLSLTVSTLIDENAGISGLVPVRIEEAGVMRARGVGAAALGEPAGHAEFGAAAPDYVSAHRDALGLSLADDFVVRSEARCEVQIGDLQLHAVSRERAPSPSDGRARRVERQGESSLESVGPALWRHDDALVAWLSSQMVDEDDDVDQELSDQIDEAWADEEINLGDDTLDKIFASLVL
ncbi:MAG: hypothetical protein WD738_03470 [Pirellulales bacterium]